MPGTEQELRGVVPKGYYDGIEVGERFQGSVEKTSKAHISNFDATTLLTFTHHQDICRFLNSTQFRIG